MRNGLKPETILLLLLVAGPVMADTSPQREAQLAHLLKHDCGSCHGMTLKGGLGPSLLPADLKDKPDELLFVTIQQGRPGTPMPPWKTLLSDDDIHYLITLLRKGPES